MLLCFCIIALPYFSCYSPRLSIQASSSSFSAYELKRLPGFQFVSAQQDFFKISTVLPNPLPPEVQNGTIVFPEKS
ncbi:hypothetical protein HMPREF1548_05276 [Clostridium sp. KLE 1755]|nr:hypothetical protein HMPREF1548_05276 [Clostridium sp. KLE 1755]